MARGCVVEGPGREELSKNLRWRARSPDTNRVQARVDKVWTSTCSCSPNHSPPSASLRQFPRPGQERNWLMAARAIFLLPQHTFLAKHRIK